MFQETLPRSCPKLGEAGLGSGTGGITEGLAVPIGSLPQSPNQPAAVQPQPSGLTAKAGNHVSLRELRGKGKGLATPPHSMKLHSHLSCPKTNTSRTGDLSTEPSTSSPASPPTYHLLEQHPWVSASQGRSADARSPNKQTLPPSYRLINVLVLIND